MENNIEDRIIKAAKSTFMKKGFKDTNMADIAAEVGLTRPALHYYFRTKERLFQAVFEEIVMKFLPRIKDHISARIPLEEKITLVVDTYLKTIQETPELPFFIITEINRNMENMFAMASESGHLVEAGRSVFSTLNQEMQEGRIRQMPLMEICYTFYGLVMAPFLSRPLGKHVFGTDPVSPEFIGRWRLNIISQMTHLLTP